MRKAKINRPSGFGAELKTKSRVSSRTGNSRNSENSMENTQLGDFVTVNQGAELLGVHPNTIRNLITRKVLVAERIGARIIRIRKQRLLELLTPYEAGEFGVWRCNRQSDAADPRPRRDPILGGGSL